MQGTSVYYWLANREVWRVGVEGGARVKVLDGVEHRGFAAGSTGLYFVRAGNPPAIWHRPFAGGPGQRLLDLQQPLGFGFDIVPDEGAVYYTLFDRKGSDLLMIDIREKNR
jgi:hypothetical protein